MLEYGQILGEGMLNKEKFSKLDLLDFSGHGGCMPMSNSGFLYVSANFENLTWSVVLAHIAAFIFLTESFNL